MERELQAMYSEYKRNHIIHHSECRMCRTYGRSSNLYEGYYECPNCLNEKGEGYFWKPSPPISFNQFKEKLSKIK